MAMVRKFVVILALLLLPKSAHGADQALTMRAFLHSVTTLYVTSEQCKHIAYLHSESYSGIIKVYLTQYYGENVPYWALPEVHQLVNNRELCINTLEENLAAYQVYSAQFTDSFPNQPVPPPLPELYMTQTYVPQYRVTAPVITK